MAGSSQRVTSMTGVGVAHGDTEVGEVVVELRSVNGRGLSVKARLPQACYGLEASLDKRVRARLTRGSVTAVIEIRTPVSRTEPILDDECAERAAAQLRELEQRLRLEGGVSVADVIAVPGVLGSSAGNSPRVSWPLPPQLAELVDGALTELVQHRLRDGMETATAINEQLAEFEVLREQAAGRAPQVIDAFRSKLRLRVDEFLQGRGRTLDDGDVVREVALFADRADVGEELQRLAAHLAEARKMLDDGGQVGRRIEFVAVELLREANTLGSKSSDVEMTKMVVAMKSAVERIRELAANLE